MYERLERSRNNAWIAIPIDGGGPGNFDADRVYVFFVFCYHLKDWIKNDTSVPEAVRSQVETFVKNTPSLALAGDLANGVKHLARDRPARGRRRAHRRQGADAQSRPLCFRQAPP
jgi:hypothetical protein